MRISTDQPLVEVSTAAVQIAFQSRSSRGAPSTMRASCFTPAALTEKRYEVRRASNGSSHT
jgi:hypothetical protein